MEQTPGQEAASANGAIDKSRVLNIKPLRSLVPVFPSQPNFTAPPAPSAPFFCVPPTGPFPRGVSPFYPFVGPDGPQRPPEQCGNTTPISTAVPISSFRTPQSNGDAGSSRKAGRNREDGYADSQRESRSQRKARVRNDAAVASSEIDTDLLANNILATHNLLEFDTERRTEGDKESVAYTLLIFDLIRRKISQAEEAKEANPGQARRPDLRAGTILLNKGIRTNSKKRIGPVPGVEIGDIFYFRMELCVVGLHAPSMAGIDYMSVKISQEEEPLAVSIVSSGGYEDNDEDEDVLIYSGQGGAGRKDKESSDQKLERGNLALEKSLHRGNEVRVIRGIKDPFSQAGKIYMYDGLYKIQESWVEKGKSGFNIFKYKLVRIPGQPEAFKTWKLVQQWKDNIIPRFGVILPDLTSGAENLPVYLVNDFDDEKGPAYFTYSSSLKYPKPVNAAEPFVGCSCQGLCQPSSNCSCIQKNGGHLPYTVNNVLVEQKPLVYECGTSCQCPPSCRNRVSQGGLKVRLEVFKTRDRGWGLRSWDPIRAGAFICEYAGEVVTNKEQVIENENDHNFYGNRPDQPVVGRRGDSVNATNLPFPIIISAKNAGNVARFMNHSCSPNVFWQPVLRSNNKDYDLHIVFHATRHIPPMMELTYNYGMVSADKAGQGKKKCLCGSPKCRGFFY